MAPLAYQPFFAASMAAAATLLGLLFVAVSVAPERTVGSRAPVERQVVAESVFTALIDALFVSMAGTLPDVSVGVVALPLSAFALLQTARAAWQLWPTRVTARTFIQRLGLVVVALAIYGLQFRDASQLLHAPAPDTSIGSEITVLFALYAFALGRSWELLGARRGILSARLSPTLPVVDEPSAAAPTQQGSAPAEIERRSRKQILRSAPDNHRRPRRNSRAADGVQPSRTSDASNLYGD